MFQAIWATKALGKDTEPFMSALQIKKGDAFVSETDTEVIPKLCKYIYSSSQEKVAFYEVRLESLMQAMHVAVHEMTLTSWSAPSSRLPATA